MKKLLLLFIGIIVLSSIALATTISDTGSSFSGNIDATGYNITSDVVNSIVFVQAGNGTDLYNKWSTCQGCHLYIPDGNYTSNALPISYSGMNIECSSNNKTIININAGSGSGVWTNSSSNLENTIIKNCNFNDLGSGNSLGINFTNQNFGIIEGVSVKNFNQSLFIDKYYNNVYNFRGLNSDICMNITGNINNVWGGRCHGATLIHYSISGYDNNLYGTTAETIPTNTSIGYLITNGAGCSRNNLFGVYAEGNSNAGTAFQLDCSYTHVKGYISAIGIPFTGSQVLTADIDITGQVRQVGQNINYTNHNITSVTYLNASNGGFSSVLSAASTDISGVSVLHSSSWMNLSGSGNYIINRGGTGAFGGVSYYTSGVQQWTFGLKNDGTSNLYLRDNLHSNDTIQFISASTPIINFTTQTTFSDSATFNSAAVFNNVGITINTLSGVGNRLVCVNATGGIYAGNFTGCP